MTEFDKQYLELLKKILTKGIEVENRTGINTIKVPSHSFEFNVGKEFPILQTKQTFYKSAIIEMLWIWQLQSNDVKELHKRGVHIWDEWMIDKDGIYRIYEPDGKCEYDPKKEVVVLDPLSVPISDPFGYRQPLKPKYDETGKVMMARSLVPGKTIRAAKYFGKEFADTIGTAYGAITNRYEMTQNIQYTIRNYPTDRRIVDSLWQNEFLRTAVLPSCVWSTEWDITGDKLNLSVHQRSCDVPLGLPFNVTQYATFLRMMAQTTGLEPGIVSYSIKDAHIYVNQLEGVKEQIRREQVYNELSKKSQKDLYELQTYLNKLLTNFSAHNVEEEKKINIDLRMIDMILNPSTPELWLNPEITDFFDFDNSKELKDIKIKKYKHMGKIDFPIAQ